MKKIKLIYWLINGLLFIGLLSSAVPSIMGLPYAVEHFTMHLGFPEYFLYFTGLTKILGVVALIIPGYPRIKEWVYAGFTFDLLGAIYASLAVGDPFSGIFFQLTILVLIALSYRYYHKIQQSTLLQIHTI